MIKQNSSIKIPNFKILLNHKDILDILNKTKSCLRSSRWTHGPISVKFENAFKSYVDVPYAYAVSNAGAGLVAVLLALEIPEGSVIICPTLTAPPTPHAILNAGMKVVFVDSNPNDLGIDPVDLKNKLEAYRNKVKAVITVHVGGWISPQINEIKKLCDYYNIPLIEDCAHAHGSFLNGKHAGSTGIAAVYSFFMTKTLTSGEGGIVTTRNKELINAISIISNYGKDQYGRHIRKGFNYKISEFCAAVALWASNNASRIINERRRIAYSYDKLLNDIEEVSIFKVPGCQCGYYKYIITIHEKYNRDRLKEILLMRFGIEAAGGVYETLCHEEPYFKSIPEKVLNSDENFIKAKDFSKSHICIPLYLGLTEDEQKKVLEGIKSALLVLEKSRTK